MIWMLWAVWAAILIAGLYGVISSLRSDKTQMWALIAVAIVAFVARGGASAGYFYGLEYEDAFVYAEGSRHLTASTVVWNSPGLAVCAVGDSTGCAAWETYPGHLFGFPALLSAVQQMFAFTPELVPRVAVVLSTLTAVFVWWGASTIYRSASKGAFAGLLFAATPAFALYGGSASSESASAAVIAVALGAIGMARDEQQNAWWLWYFVALCASILAIAVRRENVVLLPIIPACLLIGRSVPFRWSSVVPWLAVGAFAVGRVAGSLASEVGEYGQFSFHTVLFVKAIPLILRALLNPRWFGLLSVLAILGFWFAVRGGRSRDDLRENAAIIGTALIAGTMVLLYASHVRSTYQLFGVAVEPFEFLRYLNNIGPALCIVAASAAGYLEAAAARGATWKAILGGILAVYFVANIAAALSIRKELTEIEDQTRRQPALRALEAASSFGGQYPIVTFEPLVAQIYASNGATVISLAALTPDVVDAYDGRLLFLRQEQYDTDVDRNRYRQGLAALPAREPIEVSRGAGWTIVRWP